jgi:hypothetical protein
VGARDGVKWGAVTYAARHFVHNFFFFTAEDYCSTSATSTSGTSGISGISGISGRNTIDCVTTGRVHGYGFGGRGRSCVRRRGRQQVATQRMHRFGYQRTNDLVNEINETKIYGAMPSSSKFTDQASLPL